MSYSGREECHIGRGRSVIHKEPLKSIFPRDSGLLGNACIVECITYVIVAILWYPNIGWLRLRRSNNWQEIKLTFGFIVIVPCLRPGSRPMITHYEVCDASLWSPL